MPEYPLILDETKQYPHIKVYAQYRDNTLLYWDVRTDEGYLMYDTDVEDVEIDENGNEVPVTYYYSRACIPATYDFNTFSYIAVPRDSVDPKYILNDPNKPEIM